MLAKHWPHVKRISDIQEVVGYEFGPIDIVVGGIPCGPFSSAGKQHGKDDDRYLWPQTFAIIQRAHPTWVLIENVDDFTYLALDDVQSDLESEDYAVQAYVLPACAIGAPHQRARCFVVAHTASGRFQECQDPKRLHHQPDTPGARRMADAYGDRQRQWTDQPQRKPQCSTTSNAGADGTQKPLADANSQRSQSGGGCPAQGWAPAPLTDVLGGRLNPNWVEALMGFPPDWTAIDGLPSQERNKKPGNRRERSKADTPTATSG